MYFFTGSYQKNNSEHKKEENKANYNKPDDEIITWEQKKTKAYLL